MKITIKEPITGNALDLNAEPEDYNGEQGWRIMYPSSDSFVIIQKNGEWKVVDENDFNPEIVEAIGNALHEHARYTGASRVKP